jgi:hypothetical protein
MEYLTKEKIKFENQLDSLNNQKSNLVNLLKIKIIENHIKVIDNCIFTIEIQKMNFKKYGTIDESMYVFKDYIFEKEILKIKEECKLINLELLRKIK